jgi:hypothetical protein
MAWAGTRCGGRCCPRSRTAEEGLRIASRRSSALPRADRWDAAGSLTAPRKRHTATRIWNRLVDEHDADVGYPSVRDYVRARRSQIAAEVDALASVAIVPQEHAPGAEAEVDFGEFWIDLAGVRTKVFIFVYRMSHSGKAIHRVYPTLSQEAFLEGMSTRSRNSAVSRRCRSNTTTSVRR